MRDVRSASPALALLPDFLQRLCGPRWRDGPLDDDVEELIEDFWRLARDLDGVLTAEVRHDLLELLRAADANRAELARQLIAWIDLVEEVCLAVEVTYGDGTGATKLERVRSVIFQLARRFMGDVPLPSLPAFAQPFVVDLLCRASVEFVIQLVNTPERDRSLWRNALPAAAPPHRMPKLARARASFTARRRSFWEAIAAWLVRPPPLPHALQARVDAILVQWDAQTAATGKPPVQHVVQSAFGVLAWVGHHGRELRLAVDALSITVHWAYAFGDLSDAERIALIKRALLRYLEEAGLAGLIFQRFCELALDLTVDATIDLLRKRLALP